MVQSAEAGSAAFWGGNYGSGHIVESYSGTVVSGDWIVGGLVGEVGENKSAVDSSFWDIQISLQTASAGGTGITTSQMKTAGTFLSGGWDFVDETANGTDDIWWIDERVDYPRLWWEQIEDDSIP